MKTCEKPQDRTSDSASLRDFDFDDIFRLAVCVLKVRFYGIRILIWVIRWKTCRRRHLMTSVYLHPKLGRSTGPTCAGFRQSTERIRTRESQISLDEGRLRSSQIVSENFRLISCASNYTLDITLHLGRLCPVSASGWSQWCVM